MTFGPGRVLWICQEWPDPGASAGGSRTLQLIEALLSRGYTVSVGSPSLGELPATFLSRLAGRGVTALTLPLNDSGVEGILRQLAPDVVFFSRFMIEEQFGWRVREVCPNAARVVDTVDLHSLRTYRERLTEGEVCTMEIPEHYRRDPVTLREVASIFRSDSALVISIEEMSILKGLGVPEERLVYVPLCADPRETIPPHADRKHFMFIGGFRHAPNRDAVRILRETVWPLIRHNMERLPKRAAERPFGVEEYAVELHVYGAYVPGDISRLESRDLGMRILGGVPDAIECASRYRVNLAPLRFGAGLKGKILDGWIAGTPSVTTAVGAEGLLGHGPFGGAVVSTWEEFSDSSCGLYFDEEAWNVASRRGQAILREGFTTSAIVRSFLEALERVRRELKRDRTANVVGSMLWLNQARSTEYFSRWLELKKRLEPGEGIKS